MTIIKNTIILLLLSLFFVLCNKEQNEVIVPIAHTVDKAEKTLLDVSNELGYNCFSDLSKRQAEDKNLIVSPINTALAFNALIHASDNSTNKQLKQYLRINHLSNSDITTGFDNLNKLFTEIDKNAKLEGSNILAVSPDFEFDKNFEAFMAKRQYTKISKGENAGFVDEIDSKELNEKHSFQMINSLNFSASIKHQKGIDELPFYKTPDETSFVKMMVAESEFNYYSDAAIQAVELPLGRGNYNLLMIVPHGSQTLKDLSIKMDDRLLKRIKSKFKPRTLEVYLPWLDLSGIETFKRTLSNGRMYNCFDKRRADFSKLTPDNDVYMSDFEQINNFELIASNNQYHTSTNTEKSAFLIDHPFLFVVYEKYSEGVILIGKISNL